MRTRHWLGFCNAYHPDYGYQILPGVMRRREGPFIPASRPIRRPARYSLMAHPAVILKDDTLHLYSEAVEQGVWKIVLFVSADGATWSEHPESPVLLPDPTGWDAKGVRRPVLLYEPDDEAQAVKLWYSGYDFRDGGHGIGYAFSTDGVHFIKGQKNPVLQPGKPGSWDSFALDAEAIYRAPDRYYLFYGGFDALTAQGGVATFTDPRESYQKFEHNPILRNQPLAVQPIENDLKEGSSQLLVTDASAFAEDQPVVIGAENGMKWELNRIAAIRGQRQIEVYSPTIQHYPREEPPKIFSWAHRKVYPTEVWREEGLWKMICTCFGPIGPGCQEFLGYAQGRELKNIGFEYGHFMHVTSHSSASSQFDGASQKNLVLVGLPERLAGLYRAVEQSTRQRLRVGEFLWTQIHAQLPKEAALSTREYSLVPELDGELALVGPAASAPFVRLKGKLRHQSPAGMAGVRLAFSDVSGKLAPVAGSERVVPANASADVDSGWLRLSASCSGPIRLGAELKVSKGEAVLESGTQILVGWRHE